MVGPINAEGRLRMFAYITNSGGDGRIPKLNSRTQGNIKKQQRLGLTV